jgi:hypothetical protein
MTHPDIHSTRTHRNHAPHPQTFTSDPAHQALVLALTTPDTAVLIDYMYVSPAAWGRYRGLPVRKDIADAMLGGGPSGLAMNVLRLGGSMCNAPGYLWKHFRGPRWLRPPYAGTWYRYASGGWRIFEFLDLCEVPAFDLTGHDWT